MHVCRPGPRRTQQGHRQIIMGDHRDQSVRKGNTAQKNQPGDTSLATRGADGSGGLAAGRRESDNNFDHHQAAAFCTKKTGDDDVAESSSSGLANSNATDIEVLRAENAFLRLALEEAQHKLRLVGGNAGQSSSSSVVPTSREPGNGGVAYARMRRLLLKDDGFLRDSFLPFLNVEDLGRCATFTSDRNGNANVVSSYASTVCVYRVGCCFFDVFLQNFFQLLCLLDDLQFARSLFTSRWVEVRGSKTWATSGGGHGKSLDYFACYPLGLVGYVPPFVAAPTSSSVPFVLRSK